MLFPFLPLLNKQYAFYFHSNRGQTHLLVAMLTKTRLEEHWGHPPEPLWPIDFMSGQI
jgi:hypothetical protein